jgi:dTDP-4-dehydrorhamnose reductase
LAAGSLLAVAAAFTGEDLMGFMLIIRTATNLHEAARYVMPTLLQAESSAAVAVFIDVEGNAISSQDIPRAAAIVLEKIVEIFLSIVGRDLLARLGALRSRKKSADRNRRPADASPRRPVRR